MQRIVSLDQYKQYAAAVKETLDRLPWDQIERMVRLLHEARLAGRQVFVMGNGGSATTATHLACDLSKNTAMPEQPRFRIVALNDNVAVLTAWANDTGYENIFSEQLANLLQPKDIVIAISTSGNSPNVLKAVELANQRGAITIAWTGYGGGKIAALADLPVIIPNQCIEQIEDIHLMLEHMVTVALRDAMRNETMLA